MSRWCPAILLLLGLSYLPPARADDVPAALTAAVATAERDGQALYTAVTHPEPVAQPVLKDAMARVSGFCDFDYRPVDVANGAAHDIYFLIEAPPEQGIAFGRHFRVSGGVVTSSTKSCLMVPRSDVPKGAEVVGPYVTHLSSPAPTEFHVYLSLKEGVPIYVATSAGMWLVDGGRIGFRGKL